MGERTKWKLLVSNPRVPTLYGLPKIHKADDKMRPIVSQIHAPMSKTAKWLVSEFRKLNPPKNLSIKNSFEFANKIQNMRINEDEIMISFDMEALYPSIPMKEAMLYLDEWISSQDIGDSVKEMLIELSKECMSHLIE